MPKPPKISITPAELRRRAEERLQDREAAVPAPASRSVPEGQGVVHELEVHQIELEMQKAELEETRDRLEVLLAKHTDLYDSAPVGYLTLDPQGAIIEANLAIASLLGVARSTLGNQCFCAFVSPLDRPVFGVFLERVFARESRQTCEVRLQVDDKTPADVHMEAVVSDTGAACRVAITDITIHKQAEADRLILNKLESTGILAGGIAHDFNNLLTIMLLNVELAERLSPPGGALAGHLAEAQQIGLVARGLTAQLVSFADGGAPVRTLTSLTEMIRESVRPALSGSNVRCEFLLAEDLWTADVDEGQIGQVIRNLVLNAREAMPDGGLVFVQSQNVVLGADEVPALAAGEYVRVSISDQGPGIPAAVMPKIFDPYYSTKQRGPQRGMGLGLTICHSVIQKHDGALTAQSEMGVGTTFRLYLPAARIALDGERAWEPAPTPWHGRVLVMDDDEPVRKLVGLALRGMGHDVELAEHGDMAISLYSRARRRGQPIELVILDLTIRGGMGGQETAQALLAINPDLKAIAISGYTHNPVILHPEYYGFAAALAKPLVHETLLGVITQVMGRVPAYTEVS